MDCLCQFCPLGPTTMFMLSTHFPWAISSQQLSTTRLSRWVHSGKMQGSLRGDFDLKTPGQTIPGVTVQPKAIFTLSPLLHFHLQASPSDIHSPIPAPSPGSLTYPSIFSVGLNKCICLFTNVSEGHRLVAGNQ
jgi:hypothetical protein